MALLRRGRKARDYCQEALRRSKAAMAGEYDCALTEFAQAPATVAGRPSGTAYVWSAAIAWHRGNPREAHRLFAQAADQPRERSPGVG